MHTKEPGAYHKVFFGLTCVINAFRIFSLSSRTSSTINHFLKTIKHLINWSSSNSTGSWTVNFTKKYLNNQTKCKFRISWERKQQSLISHRRVFSLQFWCHFTTRGTLIKYWWFHRLDTIASNLLLTNHWMMNFLREKMKKKCDWFTVIWDSGCLDVLGTVVSYLWIHPTQ